MPKKRFYNLPYEKKQRIIESATEEMARVPLNEVSINRIIQGADISRGSFYQYFEDKNDLIGEVLCGFKDSVFEEVKEFLSSKSKDIFELFIHIFEVIMLFSENDRQQKIIRNFFNSVKNDSEFFGKITGKDDLDRAVNFIVKSVDTSNYRYSTRQDIIYLMEILSAIVCRTQSKIIRHPENKAVYFQEFKHQVDIVRNGVVIDS
jgi:hypothetical protein